MVDVCGVNSCSTLLLWHKRIVFLMSVQKSTLVVAQEDSRNALYCIANTTPVTTDILAPTVWFHCPPSTTHRTTFPFIYFEHYIISSTIMPPSTSKTIMKKVKSFKQNLRRKKFKALLHASSPSTFDIEELVFPEDDTRKEGFVYSDVDVKEEEFVNYDNEESSSLGSSVFSLAESLRGGNDELTGELYLPLDCFCWCLVLYSS